MLIEWDQGIAERRGIGAIRKESIHESFEPGPVWKNNLGLSAQHSMNLFSVGVVKSKSLPLELSSKINCLIKSTRKKQNDRYQMKDKER